MPAKKERSSKRDHFQVPLMFAFRDAFEAKDARKKLDERSGGERVLSSRGSLRRRGADEALLKRNLTLDLVSLANTIDLASAVDLDSLEYVRKSVLNYGMHDIAHLTSDENAVTELADGLKQSLLQHEPRLVADSLEVARDEDFDDVNQRIRFTVSAEMACAPLDVPIEFIAEIDVGSGKVQLARLPGTT